MTQMILEDLLSLLRTAQLFVSFQGDPTLPILSIEEDSRKVIHGSLFVAVCGYEADGHTFIEDAVRNGAVAVLLEKDISLPKHCSCVYVSDARKALSLLAHHSYGNPSQQLHVTGVTGTNGKTSLTYMLRAIYQKAGFHVGLIGTIAFFIGTKEYPASHTTPSALKLAQMLRRMHENAVTHVILELSSHALFLERTYALHLDCLVFTNLSRDHLDFHYDMESYLQAKLMSLNVLASSRKERKLFFVNGDDGAAGAFIERAESLGLSYSVYGIEGESEYSAREIRCAFGQSSCVVETPCGEYAWTMQLPGRWSVYNMLGAYACGSALGIGHAVIQDALKSLSVPGRFQMITACKRSWVVIDYAHTPDALENVLRTLREFQPSRILTVFGCGGERDQGKRAVMGAISSRYSDLSIITSDNPRSEAPKQILLDIQEGCAREHGAYILVEDRYTAISMALHMMQEKECVLIAGKGHERGQVLGTTVLDFHDPTIVMNILKDLG